MSKLADLGQAVCPAPRLLGVAAVGHGLLVRGHQLDVSHCRVPVYRFLARHRTALHPRNEVLKQHDIVCGASPQHGVGDVLIAGSQTHSARRVIRMLNTRLSIQFAMARQASSARSYLDEVPPHLKPGPVGLCTPRHVLSFNSTRKGIHPRE